MNHVKGELHTCSACIKLWPDVDARCLQSSSEQLTTCMMMQHVTCVHHTMWMHALPPATKNKRFMFVEVGELGYDATDWRMNTLSEFFF